MENLEWYSYPKFELHIRFNKNGYFERFISGNWKPLSPSINTGRKVLTFSTSINNEKVYCVVPNFIYNFFNPKTNFDNHEIVYNDFNPNNCSIDNLILLPIDSARNYVNKPIALERLSSFVSNHLPHFIIKDIKWVHDLIEKPSKKGEKPTIQYTSNYDRTDVLIYNTKTKVGDWVKYRTIMSNKYKSKNIVNIEEYLNKIFLEKNLVPIPENFDESRVYKTPNNFPDVYLDYNNELFLIGELCLIQKTHTQYQLSLTSLDDLNVRFNVSPLEIVHQITGDELRKQPHTFWFDDVIENKLKEISDNYNLMPTYSQLKTCDSKLFSHFVHNGGKRRYVEFCEKLNLSFPVTFFDDNGKDFDSEDEFRIFAILDFNGYKDGVDVFRQVPYPDKTGRTLDFEIKTINTKLEFTGEVTDIATQRILEKQKDAETFGWQNFKIMKYISNEPHINFVKRLSTVLDIELNEPNWKFYYEKYGYGIDRLKSEIKKFLLENYDGNQTQNELSQIKWNLMRWAQRIWGDFVNVLFQNNIEIKHRFRVTPEFLNENLHEVISVIITDSGYLPCYYDTITNKSLSLQTKQFVRGIHKVYGKEFCDYDGFIYTKYHNHFKKPKQKPSKDYTVFELSDILSGYDSRSKVQTTFPGLYSQASKIGLIDKLYPIV